MYDQNGDFYLYRTNIGNSFTDGAELFIEYEMKWKKNVRMSIFTSTAFFSSRYEDAEIRSGGDNINISGNRVESVPKVITRNGLTMNVSTSSISFLYSYTGSSYADPLNTEQPAANGSVGRVPAYGVIDINASWRISGRFVLRVSVSNLTNEQYFTKRPQFYPGPGVWSSDGRSFVVTLGFKV